MRSEDGGAGEKSGGVGMNDGGVRFSVSVSPAGDEWLVGFSGKRGSARFTGSKCRFSPIFLCFYPLRPVVPPPRAPGALTMTKS